MTSDVLNKVHKKIKIKIQKISLFYYGYFICLPLNYCNLAMMLHICYLDGLFDTVDNGWRYDFALGGVPSLCLFVGFIFCPESPRYWLGLPSKFCSEEIPRNRLGTVLGYSAEKGLLSHDSVCLGISPPKVWNITERNGTEFHEKF